MNAESSLPVWEKPDWASTLGALLCQAGLYLLINTLLRISIFKFMTDTALEFSFSAMSLSGFGMMLTCALQNELEGLGI